MSCYQQTDKYKSFKSHFLEPVNSRSVRRKHSSHGKGSSSPCRSPREGPWSMQLGTNRNRAAPQLMLSANLINPGSKAPCLDNQSQSGSSWRFVSLGAALHRCSFPDLGPSWPVQAAWGSSVLFSSLWMAKPLMGSLSPGKPCSLASAFHCKLIVLKGRSSSLCTQVGKRNSSRQPWKGGKAG